MYKIPSFFEELIRGGTSRYDIPSPGLSHRNGMKLSIQGKTVEDILRVYSLLAEYLSSKRIAHKIATSRRVALEGPQGRKILTIYVPDELVGWDGYTMHNPNGWRKLAEDISQLLRRGNYTGWYDVHTPPLYEHYSNAVFFRNDRDEHGRYIPSVERVARLKLADFFREITPPDSLSPYSNGSVTKDTNTRGQGGSSLPTGDVAQDYGRPSVDSPSLKSKNLDRAESYGRAPAEQQDFGYVDNSGSGSARVIPNHLKQASLMDHLSYPYPLQDPQYMQMFIMSVENDVFVHITSRDRAESILRDGVLYPNHYNELSIRGAYAISLKWGSFLPRTQVNRHMKMRDDKVLLVFKTSTKPTAGWREEVKWNTPVKITSGKIISFSRYNSALFRRPLKGGDYGDDFYVMYDMEKAVKEL